MKKYIDADLLKNEICKNKIMSRELIAQRILHIIDNQPATDVVEIIHGKWIDVPLNSDPNYFAYKYNLRTKCSVCDFAMPREYQRITNLPTSAK